MTVLLTLNEKLFFFVNTLCRKVKLKWSKCNGYQMVPNKHFSFFSKYLYTRLRHINIYKSLFLRLRLADYTE